MRRPPRRKGTPATRREICNQRCRWGDIKACPAWPHELEPLYIRTELSSVYPPDFWERLPGLH
ncbi:hypothetical protein ACFY2W_19180 [Streptomyces sp. NPDC001262]|uniref:hypothetical protein n=1 Tax=Streptomyces sp. NPDC001262 TaxID=3364552 RepID=UPI0036B3B126